MNSILGTPNARCVWQSGSLRTEAPGPALAIVVAAGLVPVELAMRWEHLARPAHEPLAWRSLLADHAGRPLC